MVILGKQKKHYHLMSRPKVIAYIVISMSFLIFVCQQAIYNNKFNLVQFLDKRCMNYALITFMHSKINNTDQQY